MSKAKRFNHKATYVMEPCVVLSTCLSVDFRVQHGDQHLDGYDPDD